ncbi:AraC family transcriptional regulator [Allorhizobium sp. BGMRC 0089]|uniref:AraC family transcriptional regulator n=1 Tax=Allorhizobium sonneratiae TaxID=2934936 RepID=UPI002033AD5E|nr:AraC family transcriptional regulator [Allorhizobium sonneratiae]MCM2293934.1 AraC family transcriptional regulator [Allorhizobium sonneratiae]
MASEENDLSGAATIRASVLIPIIDRLEKTGMRTEPLLARHGIARGQISDPYAMVPISRYIGFFEEAAKTSGSPLLGALMGTGITPGDLGPTGVLFSISPNIREAIHRLTRYVSAIQGATSTGLQEFDGDYVWSYQISSPSLWPRRQDSEFTLSVCCQLIRLCFSRHWRPLEVQFEHPEPPDTAGLTKIFRAPLKFGQSSNRLVISRTDAQKIYRSEDPALVAVLEHHITELAALSSAPQSLPERVRALIGANLGYRKIRIADVAKDLGLAPRTLQRRLMLEGTSLREIVEDYRRELAEKQVRARLSKRKIADTLGYADSTVFWRARRRWHEKDG